MKKRIAHSIYLCLLLLIFIAGKAHAQYAEYEVKAAYIFHFAKFMEWNTEKEDSTVLTIGLYQNDPFGIILDKTLLGRSTNGKQWNIVQVANQEEALSCDFLFISDIERYDLLKLLERLKKTAIITIGDEIEGFCQDGGLINFSPQYSSHRFEINNKRAILNGITISPKLLVLSKLVSDDEDEF